MHCLAACEEAERIIKKAKYYPSSVPAPSHYQTRIGTETNIRQLYETECARDLKTGQPHLRSGSMLLEKLVARERLHTLIINLYAGNKGYSIAVRTFVPSDENCLDSSGTASVQNKMCKEVPMDSEFSYKLDRLLRYIDNEELPYFIAAAVEVNCSYMFYSGCIIAEVRDYRQSYPKCICDTHYVLLKPSTHTFHSDTAYLASKHDLNENDKRQLENKLLVKTIPLCLDPSPANAIVANKIQHERQLFNTLDLRKTAHSYSQVATNRKRKLTNTSKRGLDLIETTNYHKARTRKVSPALGAVSNNLLDLFAPIPAPSLEMPPLDVPHAEIPVAKYARVLNGIAIEDKRLVPINVFERKIPDPNLEQRRVNHIKLTLFQRLSNLEFIGELYLDSEYQPGHSKGSACRFSLGTSYRYACSYMNQFLEIFHETSSDEMQHGSSLTNSIPPNPANTSVSQTGENQTANNGTASNSLANGNSNTNNMNSNNVNSNSGSNSIGKNLVLMHNNQVVVSASSSQINTNNLPILQSQLQSNNTQVRQQLRHAVFPSQPKTDSQFSQANVINTKSATSNNATILSRLNSTPANHLNSAETAAVANAIINNSNIAIVNIPTHRSLAIGQQKPNAAVRNVAAANSRIGNRTNQIVVTNANSTTSVNSLQHSQPVQINLATLPHQQNQVQSQGFNIGFTTVPINSLNTNATKQPINNHSARLIAPSATSPGIKRTIAVSPSLAAAAANASSNDSRLHALLKGTAAADHQIEGINSSDSGLLERIRASSGSSPVPGASPNQSPKSVVQLIHAQSPKFSSPPLSSPPLQQTPQGVANTIQSLNLAQLTNFSGHQNEYVQLHPILPISMASSVSHAGVLLPIPVTASAGLTTTGAHIVPNATVSGTSNAATFTILTQSVNKAVIRGGATQQLQVVNTTLQRPRNAGNASGANRALLTGQRTANSPIRIAAPNSNVTAMQGINSTAVAGNSIMATLSSQPQLQLTLQKQPAPFQQCITQQQQLQQRLSQQQQKAAVTPAAVATKYRRRSNAADTNK